MPESECASPVHASQESTASECSDTDSDDYRLNVNTPVVVAWEGQHSKLNLHLQYDRSTSTAFLKLRASLVLKASSPAKTYLYLLVPPERVQSLLLDDSPDPDTIPSDTAKILGSSFTCLRVSLNAVIDLVGPKSIGHKPKNQAEGRVLDELRSFVRSAAFSIFIPHQAVSKSRLLSLCYGISDRLLRSDSGQTDLACLYEGRGGIKIPITRKQEPTNQAASASQRTHGDNPPSYADAGPAPSGAAGPAKSSASKKRRRDSDATVELSDDLLALMRKMVREEVRVQVSEEVQKLESRLTDNLEHLINKHTDSERSRWTEELEMTRQEFDDKLEDDFYGVRMKLEDYIKEELTEAEERIIEHLQSTASVHLEFGS